MSGIPPLPEPTLGSRPGAVVTSITAQGTFFAALIASGVLGYLTKDYTVFQVMAGVAATNATAVVQYWVGSSNGSARKTDALIDRQGP